jgi:hypothetical protein
MNRISVSSSNLASVGYDASHGILEIEFLNGSIYQYLNIPLHIYEGLMNASSHGRYFDTHIKKVGYSYRRTK